MTAQIHFLISIILLEYDPPYCSVENSTRMPKSNGSFLGPGLPSVIPRFGPHGDMTTPLLGPTTPITPHSRSSNEYESSLSPHGQHRFAPVVPARNIDSPFHPGNIPAGSLSNQLLATSPFSSKLPTSMQSQLDIDFGFGGHQDQIKYEYDSTGIFHWCPARDIDKCLVSRQEIAP